MLGGHGHAHSHDHAQDRDQDRDHAHDPDHAGHEHAGHDRPRRSLNVEGSYQHILTDLFGFAATAVAAVVILLTGFRRADAIASLLIAAVMLYASYGLLRASVRVMMEAAPEGIDPDAIGRALAAQPGVAEVHDLHIWEVTSGFPAISAHIVVDAGHDCHEVRRALSTLLSDQFGLAHSTLQVEHARAAQPPMQIEVAAHGAGTDPVGATEEGSFRGTRARRIAWQSWSPAGDQQPKGVVTIAHGYGEHIGRYQHVAARLNEAGISRSTGSTITGMGARPGSAGGCVAAGGRGRPRSADRDRVAAPPSRPAAVPARPQHGRRDRLRYAMAHQQRLTGLVAVGAAGCGRGRCRRCTPFARGARAGAARERRSRGSIRAWSAATTRWSRHYIADPLNHHGPDPGRGRPRVRRCTSAPSSDDVRQITLPTLLMWGTADRLCPPAGSELVAANIGSEDLTVKRYEGLFHEIMNEPEQEQVLDDLVAWLDQRTGAPAET